MATNIIGSASCYGSIEYLKYVLECYEYCNNKDNKLEDIDHNNGWMLRYLCNLNRLEAIKLLFDFEEKHGRKFNLYLEKGNLFTYCSSIEIVLYFIHKIKNKYDNICTYQNICKYLDLDTPIILYNIECIIHTKQIPNKQYKIYGSICIVCNNIYDKCKYISDFNYVFVIKK